MIRNLFTLICLLSLTAFTFSCQKEESAPADAIPQSIMTKVEAMGFSTDGMIKYEDGYLVERDIYLTPEFLNSNVTEHRVPDMEQYSTNNLVATNGGRTITVGFVTNAGRSQRFKPAYSDALNIALDRYNALGLEITFQRVPDNSNPDVAITRFPAIFEVFGFLGSAGFPSAAGDIFPSISLNGEMDLYFGYSQKGIATVMAHELGHCIGFRHTDYFDRSISCGGTPVNEGDGGVGANLIPGTPSGADLSRNGSWMLSCASGSVARANRPFTKFDKIALRFLY